MAINDQVSLRVRVRHSNSHTGVPGEWNFNGDPLFRDGLGPRPLPPEPTSGRTYNNLLGSVELAVARPPAGSIASPPSTISTATHDTNLNSNPCQLRSAFDLDTYRTTRPHQSRRL